MSSCSHPHGEELLRLALESDAFRHSELCTRCAEEVAALQAFVARCRRSAVDPEPPRGFVAAVLSRTTRENLGLRGDLALIGGFVRHRLRDSRLVRVAAASLLAHLLALPVLAWIALGGSEHEWTFRTGIEPWSEVSRLPATPPEPDSEPEFPAADESELVEPLLDLGDPGDLGDIGERAGATVRANLERARSVLRAGSLPDPADSAKGRLARVLNARSRLAHGGEFDETVLEALEEEDLLVLSLALEVVLDRYMREGVIDPRVGPGWTSLQRRLGALGPEDLEAGTRVLAGAVLSRARSYGLLEPLAEGDAAAEAPLGPAWRAGLRTALERRAEVRGSGPDSGDAAVVSAWIVWSRAE